jgi:hypothetical protein
LEKEVKRYGSVIGGDKFIAIFKIGLIIEHFNLLGKTSEEGDLLLINVKGEMRKRALVFKVLIGISS